jgi:Glycosyl transferase family 2
MRLVMTLLVRDEEDVLAAHLDYHLSQGVDFVIATDNASVDATPEILGDYARHGRLRRLHEPADDYAQGVWVTRMARLAAREHGADWVINGDADEFWWPRQGDLKSSLAALPAAVAQVSAPRHNFPPTPSEAGPFFERMTVREVASRNAEGLPLPPKVCHRADPAVEVEQGNHRAALSRPGETAAGEPLEILHFPLRTYRQFANKIAKGGAAYERNRELPPAVGSTWRRLYRLHREGRLREFYDSQALAPAAVEEGLGAGRLVVDTRLRDHLRGLAGGEP